MELYLALHKIVVKNGKGILEDDRSMNMLCDYKAFEQYPATKNILREIIDSKYSQKLYNCKLWDMQAEKLVSEFVTKSGFQKALSYYVFQSIAYSLGWIKTVDVPVESQNDPQKTPSVKFSNMVPFRQRFYLRHLVNINIDFESYGVTPFLFLDSADNSPSGFIWNYKPNEYIHVVLAIEGSLGRDMHIKYTTYDANGKMKCNGKLGKFAKSKFRGVLEIDKQIYLGTHINRITRIVFFDE